MSYNIKVCNSLFDTKNKFGWLIGWYYKNKFFIILILTKHIDIIPTPTGFYNRTQSKKYH